MARLEIAVSKYYDSVPTFGDNPTGVGAMPVISYAQVDTLSRPGGGEHTPAGQGMADNSTASDSRPGGQEGGAISAGDAPMFGRPGGAESAS